MVCSICTPIVDATFVASVYHPAVEIAVAFGHGDRSRCGFRVMQIADRSRDLLFHVRA